MDGLKGILHVEINAASKRLTEEDFVRAMGAFVSFNGSTATQKLTPAEYELRVRWLLGEFTE